MKDPSAKQILYFLIYAASTGVLVHFQDYGQATFFGLATIAIINGW